MYQFPGNRAELIFDHMLGYFELLRRQVEYLPRFMAYDRFIAEIGATPAGTNRKGMGFYNVRFLNSL